MSQTDTRVQSETTRATNTSWQRDMGGIVVLYSYTTPVAVYDTTEDVLYVSNRINVKHNPRPHEEPFSHTSKCHVGRFRTNQELDLEDDLFIEHADLEISILEYDLARKKATLRGEDGPEWDTPSVIDSPEPEDEVPSEKELTITEELVDEAVSRASKNRSAATIQIGAVKISIPVDSSELRA